MNLQKLFETQKVLRDRINYQREDRFEKLILALLVEIGECANEWRGFKFWSKNQKARTSLEIDCPDCNRYDTHMCCTCQGHGTIELGPENPLLEEYVDGLHFVLEIGLEHGDDIDLKNQETFPEASKRETITKQFTKLFSIKWGRDIGYQNNYMQGLELYIGLGEMLGFTWEQIEEAYFEKNKVNHERQNTGY
ncbi:dUTP diphosphatase [Niallia sp. RD1]|uniref:dUTP diphosphatase n=1 Tax=Niallia sp. RD1 TaxID=2962858 RepID=UPI0020C1B2DB|nr:dUTP diphosphatase [Niallia sp. RD1]UTI41079.1 dUTP diphosphatase [Niallia sp. RD1]